MNKRNSRFSIVSSIDDTNPVTRSTDIAAIPNIQDNVSQKIQWQIAEHLIVIWLNLNASVDDSIIKLQYVVNSIKSFTHLDQCVDFLTDVRDKKVLMIISESFEQSIVPLIHDIHQLHFIYLFNHQQTHNQQQYKKVKGMFSQIEDICDVLKLDISRLMVDLTSFSIISITSSSNLNELDQSFMYTQLLKEIILEIQHSDNARQDFIAYYHAHFEEEGFDSNLMSEFQKHYEDQSPIWWYTKAGFLYSTLNKALRTQDTETIIKMGFFLQDLHRDITQRHSQVQNASEMIVYRGQGVSENEFKTLEKNIGSLISFNSFLSTSTDRDVSLAFADSNRDNPDLIGILFRMQINSSIASTPYISVTDISSFTPEAEILFSMHTIFRIGEMNKINDKLWEINLILTDDNDEMLKNLTSYIREELGPAAGWYRMALLMHKMGKFEKALEILHILLQTTLHEDEDTDYLIQNTVVHNISYTHQRMGNYSRALLHLEKVLENFESVLTPGDPIFATIYNNIASVHQLTGDCELTLLNLKKALTILQKNFPPDAVDLAFHYHNMAVVYELMGESPIALSHFEKALEIWQKSLPSNHPNLAATYNNIGEVHRSTGNYTMALLYLDKAVAIRLKSLPSDHRDLAVSYNSIGKLYQSTGNYPMALSHFEKALGIFQASVSLNHPDLAAMYSNIGEVYRLMGRYTEALLHLEKALALLQNSLESNHPILAGNYNNLGLVHQSVGNYAQALSYFKTTFEICQKYLPSNHPHLAASFSNIASVYQSMGDYSISLSYFEKSVAMLQKSFPPNHPIFALCYSNIGEVYRLMGEYRMALSYFSKALETHRKSSPSNHPNLALYYNGIGLVYQSMDEYPMALAHFEKAGEVWQRSLPSNHPHLATNYNNLGLVYQSMGDDTKALSYFEKAIEIHQKSLPPNHPNLATNYNNLGLVYQSMGDDAKALSHFEKAIEIYQKSLPPNHPNLTLSYTNMADVYTLMSDYPMALLYLKKVLQIQQNHLPPNHPDLVTTYDKIIRLTQLVRNC